jgi:hypothetical protein
MAFAAALTFGQSPALAQSASATTTNTAAPNSVGPRELQNFSLNGTVTRQADAPPPASTRAPVRTAPDRATTAVPTEASVSTPAPARERGTTRVAEAPRSSPERPIAGETLSFNVPPAPTPAAALPANAPSFTPTSGDVPATLAPDQKLLLWPWLLLALVIGATAAFLLWRRRAHEAYAGGGHVDAFVAPGPATPAPRPAPPRAAEPVQPKPVGVVSTRLRPWVEVLFVPIACTVDDDRVTMDFEVQLTNSGSGPARDIIIEASMFNAGATQDQDIGTFFANPVGQGERIQTLAPLQQVSIRTQLVAPRANIQLFELGGRMVFVPLVAFNALYRLSSGTGQTSVAYLLGRETNTEKLGPFRADQGARAFTGLGTRPLPLAVRK